jgi:hypothetical protein
MITYCLFLVSLPQDSKYNLGGNYFKIYYFILRFISDAIDIGIIFEGRLTPYYSVNININSTIAGLREELTEQCEINFLFQFLNKIK